MEHHFFFKREIVDYWQSRTLWNIFNCKIESENNSWLMNYIFEVSFKSLILLSQLSTLNKRDFCLSKILNFREQNCIYLHNHPSRFLAITFIWGTHYVSVIQTAFLESRSPWLQMPIHLWWFNSWNWYITINLIVLLRNSLILPQ